MIEENSLSSAWRQLRRAEEAAQRLPTVQSEAWDHAWFDAWEDFVDRLEKVWVRTYEACKKHRNGFQQWKSKFEKDRDSDPLLVYLKQARHAEEHQTPGTIRMGPPRNLKAVGGTRSVSFSWDPPAGPELAPVTNKRESPEPFLPPSEHLGERLAASDPATVARLGLAFYRAALEDATRRIEKR
ncbi:MAG: hypothetical protein ACR2H9_16075 [Longimicrobiaceae bacterium]